jgi:hypothetical protein
MAACPHIKDQMLMSVSSTRSVAFHTVDRISLFQIRLLFVPRPMTVAQVRGAEADHSGRDRGSVCACVSCRVAVCVLQSYCLLVCVATLRDVPPTRVLCVGGLTMPAREPAAWRSSERTPLLGDFIPHWEISSTSQRCDGLARNRPTTWSS